MKKLLLSVLFILSLSSITHAALVPSSWTRNTTTFKLYYPFFQDNVGIGTSSPYSKLSVVGTTTAAVFEATTTATSTAKGGWNISGGCFAIGGVCISGSGAGSSAANSKWSTSSPAGGVSISPNDQTASLYIGNTSPLQLNGFGSGYARIQTSTSSNDIEQWQLINRSVGTSAAGCVFFLNDKSTLGGVGAASDYYGGMCMAGSNYNIPGFNGLRPNGLGVFAKDGPLTLGSGATVGASSTIYFQAGSGLDASYDMTLTGGTAWLGLGTSTPWAKLAVQATSSSGVPFFLVASSTNAAYTTLFTIASSTGFVGVATSSPYARLSVSGNGVFDDNVRSSYFVATSTTASVFPYATTTNISVSGLGTSTFSGPISLKLASTTATSTMSGINLPYGGCYAIAGTCIAGAAGSGTVTSVSQTVPAGFSITGSPVTTSGTLAIGFSAPINSILVADSAGTGITSTSSEPLYVGRITASSTTASQFPYASTTMVDFVTASSTTFFASAGSVSAASYSRSGDPNTGIYFNGQDSVDITTGGTSRLSINTASISGALSFIAPAGTAASPSFRGVAVSVGTGGLFFASGGQVGVSCNAIECARFNSAGNFGLGTSTPEYKLQVASSTGPQIAISDSGNITTNHWTFTNSGGRFFLSTSSPTATISTSTPALTVDLNSNIGLGTSTPGSKLSIQGVANLTSATSSFYGNGIDIASGCFAVNHLCVGGTGGGSGTVTSVATNNGLTGGTITTTGTLGLDITNLSSGASVAWNGTTLTATGTPALTAGYFIATTTTASQLAYATTTNISVSGLGTSTFSGPVSLTLASTTATSTMKGINLPYGGCFAISGVCIAGSGTVTSVAQTVPAGFSVTGSPVTTNGTLAITFSAPINSILVANSAGTGITSTSSDPLYVSRVTATSTTAASTFVYASTTNVTSTLASTTNLNVSSLTSALVQTGADGVTAEYAGTSCTNQFPRSLSALGIATCASVANTDLTNSTISGISLGSNLASLSNDATLNGSSYNGSAAVSDWSLNLANPNSWTGLQQFISASSTSFSALNNIRVGTTATTSIMGDLGTSTFSSFISAVAASTTATSTLKGVNLPYGGCFAINGVCLTDTNSGGTVTSVTLATPNSTLSLGGTNPVTTSGTINADLNLAHRNDWTALQTFISASSTSFSALNNIRIGTTATTSLMGDLGTSTFSSFISAVAASTTATSTMAGINLPYGGCFAINGSCIGTSGGGTVTAVTGTWPIISSGGATPNLTWGGLSTSTAAVLGNIPYFSGVNTFANVATTTIGCSGNITCTGFSALGSASTISFTGTLPIANGGTNQTAFGSNMLVWFDGTRLVATSSTVSVGNLLATSTTATSTFYGMVSHVATTTFLANVGYPIASTTGSTLMNINWTSGNTQRIILGANTTIVVNATSSTPIDGGRYILKVCQGGAGGFTGSFSNYGQLNWPILTGTTTILTTANSCTHIWMSWDAYTQDYTVFGSTTALSI